MFRDGIRVLLLVHRKKDGSTWRDRHKELVITDCEEHFNKQLERLIEKAKASKDRLRVYSTVNRRNMQKAIREFKTRQLAIDYSDPLTMTMFYRTIHDKFISCLMQQNCRDETIFKFDVDIKDYRNKMNLLGELEEHTKILSINETKQGWHIFTEPFNPNLIDYKKYYTEFNKDSLVLWHY